jgi:hypothetical protein
MSTTVSQAPRRVRLAKQCLSNNHVRAPLGHYLIRFLRGSARGSLRPS